MVPQEVVICPTERQEDGLALSSRNVYLGPRRRAVGVTLFKALSAAEDAYKNGKKLDRKSILGAANDVVKSTLDAQAALSPAERALFEVDYISLADPNTMLEIDTVDPVQGAVLSGAIKMLALEETKEGEDVGHAGGPPVRLIDNIILKPVSS